MGRQLTIIPDVHGRTFWRRAVQASPRGGKIIFLGDYLDPYPWEEITPGDSTRMLREIIELKKERPDDIVLLLGNHDMGYLDPVMNTCRRDWYGAARNKALLEENLDLFDITHVESFRNARLLFSHAGIGRSWLERHWDVFGAGPFDPLVLNAMLHDPKRREALYRVLADASWSRGGEDPTGSPIWADIDEFIGGEKLLEGYFHVFGHSLHQGGPARAGDAGICLDCRMAFLLDEEPLALTPLP